MNHDNAIRAEIGKAAERLGGDGRRISALPQVKVYDELEQLGADRFLLAYVNSWGDTMTDAHILEGLKRWNRGEQAFDGVIASTGGKRG